MAAMMINNKYILIICNILFCVSASPITNHDASKLQWEHLLAGVIGLFALVCFIKLLAMCTEICQQRSTYKEFDDPQESYNPDLNPSSPVASDFSMYPPVESTPDAVITTTPVVFEPLPDLTQLRPQLPQVANSVQLRPKVAIVSGDVENEEDFDEVMASHDPSQDTAKLHNLISNSRSQLPREQISYIKELGLGWFGKVLQGEGHNILPGHKKTKIVVQMLKEDANTHEQLAFLQEAAPYREVDHGNVLKMLGQCVETSPLLTVLELCPFGDLKTYLRSHKVAMDSFNEKGLLLKFASDIAAGLQALHDAKFVHRDFAARNCALSSELSVKIGDYGLSEELYKEDYEFDDSGCGIPIRWLAPESVIVSNNGKISLKYISKSCNVWSFGVTLWEILTFGNLPYSDLNNDHVIRLVLKERSLCLTKPDVNFAHLDRLYELMQLCWASANSRPSLRQLRIMLLHLLSNKLNTHNNDAFEEKWNKLLPRKPAQIVQVGDGNQHADFGYATTDKTPSPNSNRIPNGSASVIVTVSTNEIGSAAYPFKQSTTNNSHGVVSHEHPSYTNSNVQQPENGLIELDASQLGGVGEGNVAADNLVEKGGVGSEARQGLSLGEELVQVHRSGGDSFTSPVNELSLAAELDDLQNNDGDVTPVNDDLLIQPEQTDSKEATFSSSVDSQLKDEILIFDNMGEVVPDVQNTHMPQPGTPALFVNTNMSNSETPGRSESIVSSAIGPGQPNTNQGQKKFAAMLQTVVTSFDNEEAADYYSTSFGEQSFEAIPEELEHDGHQPEVDEKLVAGVDSDRNTDSITPTDDVQNNSSKSNRVNSDSDKDDIEILSDPDINKGDDTVVLDNSAESNISVIEQSEGTQDNSLANSENNTSIVNNNHHDKDLSVLESSQTAFLEKQDNLKDVVEGLLQLDGEGHENTS